MNMSCITCYYGKIEEGKLSCKDRHESLEGLNYEELCRLASECAKYRFYADGEREERREVRRQKMIAALKEVEE